MLIISRSDFTIKSGTKEPILDNKAKYKNRSNFLICDTNHTGKSNACAKIRTWSCLSVNDRRTSVYLAKSRVSADIDWACRTSAEGYSSNDKAGQSWGSSEHTLESLRIIAECPAEYWAAIPSTLTVVNINYLLNQCPHIATLQGYF